MNIDFFAGAIFMAIFVAYSAGVYLAGYAAGRRGIRS